MALYRSLQTCIQKTPQSPGEVSLLLGYDNIARRFQRNPEQKNFDVITL